MVCCNYVGELQELCQSQAWRLPVYGGYVNKSSLQHAPDFWVNVTLEGYGTATGSGTTKKNAKQDAARNLLEVIKSRTLSPSDSPAKKGQPKSMSPLLSSMREPSALSSPRLADVFHSPEALIRFLSPAATNAFTLSSMASGLSSHAAANRALSTGASDSTSSGAINKPSSPALANVISSPAAANTSPGATNYLSSPALKNLIATPRDTNRVSSPAAANTSPGATNMLSSPALAYVISSLAAANISLGATNKLPSSASRNLVSSLADTNRVSSPAAANASPGATNRLSSPAVANVMSSHAAANASPGATDKLSSPAITNVISSHAAANASPGATDKLSSPAVANVISSHAAANASPGATHKLSSPALTKIISLPGDTDRLSSPAATNRISSPAAANRTSSHEAANRVLSLAAAIRRSSREAKNVMSLSAGANAASSLIENSEVSSPTTEHFISRPPAASGGFSTPEVATRSASLAGSSAFRSAAAARGGSSPVTEKKLSLPAAASARLSPGAAKRRAPKASVFDSTDVEDFFTRFCSLSSQVVRLSPSSIEASPSGRPRLASVVKARSFGDIASPSPSRQPLVGSSKSLFAGKSVPLTQIEEDCCEKPRSKGSLTDVGCELNPKALFPDDSVKAPGAVFDGTNRVVEQLDIGLSEPVEYDRRWYNDAEINSKDVSSELERFHIWTDKAGFQFQFHELYDGFYFLKLCTSPEPIVCHGYGHEDAARNAINFGKLLKLI